eukprot:CAMPEP_0183804176 /NCGR_PEP_ID=MMETSP0803_2-20130417/34669_1 /TAXON_ID=195967 /ORGANISM="Crustomastix stigmata, Strain CCMP3273" /LENGTH=537 /DNA_ID=CAMNT_0026048925 /DNA_START=131 /DNA_END=1744 /DNA_ORIENTATION=-
MLLTAAVLEGLTELATAQHVWKVLQWVFRWLPHYNVARAVYNISQNQHVKSTLRKSPWELSISGWELIFMLVEGTLFACCTVAIEFHVPSRIAHYVKKLFKCLPADPPTGAETASLELDEDEDVAAERQRISEHHLGEDVLVAHCLRKVYQGGKVAVQELSFGIPEGCCFGLLGVNGAGKTSTFKMLTGELDPTSGDAFVRADNTGTYMSMTRDLDSIRRLLGYVPQFGGLQANMTPREHLQFYAAVRGIPDANAKTRATELLQCMGLTEYADRTAGSLSGGNKRKLSVAIALVGNPRILLLDEPSTGMDVGAKRHMWDELSKALIGCCMILTTHSMDECEALCNRAGILVQGRLRCLGTLQHLKQRHGQGYTVEMRSNNPTHMVVVVRESLPGAVLEEQHHDFLRFRLPPSSKEYALSLARVFQVVQSALAHGDVQDYSVSQTTLEEVFLSFATQQTHKSVECTVSLPSLAAGHQGHTSGSDSEEGTCVEMTHLAALRAVQCPCGAVLYWTGGAQLMRCAECGELVESSATHSSDV